MKIKHQLMISGSLTMGLIVLNLAFALHDMGTLVTKLRFVEIADDLNASFLEMRLAEKNYFLFNDNEALSLIIQRTQDVEQTLDRVEPDITSAAGPDNYRQMRTLFSAYIGVVSAVSAGHSRDKASEARVREAGHLLWEFSQRLTGVEREDVNQIITDSRRGLLLTSLAILALALFAGPFIYMKIMRSLHKVEDQAHRIAEGSFRHIEGPVPANELGSVIRAVNAMSDELRSRESELVQSKKLASLGTLTAGVAHEITNPVNNISLLAETFGTLYDDFTRDEHIELMDKIHSEVERIRQIVVGLLHFSKPKQADPRQSALNEVVQGTLRLVRNMLDVSNIEVHLDLAEGLPPVFVDENQIHQVLVNIIGNAIQAMEPGGRLFIATRPGEAPGYVDIVIRDTGKGIPPEHLPHIFDPFFSTKGVDGTGLGLSVSYGIITQHGGRLKAENAPEGGAAFTVELPIHQQGEPGDEHSPNHGD